MGFRRKRNKYGAIRTKVDGINFASKGESRRYKELVLLQEAGHITDLTLQPRFPLEVDGYKVCGMLKFDKNFAKVPVIILTARAGDADREMAKDVKADDYMTKPFEPSELLPKIKKFLKEE